MNRWIAKRRGRRDATHGTIRAVFEEQVDLRVVDCADVGFGAFDFLIHSGESGCACWVEAKNGAKPPSERLLTDDEYRFGALWAARTRFARAVATCGTDALVIAKLLREGSLGQIEALYYAPHVARYEAARAKRAERSGR